MKSASVGQAVPQHMWRNNTSLMGNLNTKNETQIENDTKKQPVEQYKTYSELNKNVSGFDKEPRKDSYVTQLQEVRKTRDDVPKRTAPPISRYVPQFTIHFASVAYRNNYRSRNLRKDKQEQDKQLNMVDLKSKTDNSTNTRKIFLENKATDNSTNTRKLFLENKAKSADYVSQYRLQSKGVLVYQGNVQFSPPIKLKVEEKTAKIEEENNALNDVLKHFGNYSPKNSAEKLGNKGKHVGSDTKCKMKPVENERSPVNTKHNVDELLILNTKIVKPPSKEYVKNESCTENENKMDENCRKMCCQTRTFFEKKSKVNEKLEDSKSKTADTDAEKDWKVGKLTSINELANIHYPKETKNAVVLMLSDIKTFDDNDEGKYGKTSVEDSILKFNNMCKNESKVDKEDKVKSTKTKSCDKNRNKNCNGTNIDCECSQTSSKCDHVESLFKNNSRLHCSSGSTLSSLSRGISCRSLFYDKTKKDSKRNRKPPSHAICKRNSSSYIESSSSLSTDVSYCRVQRLFQNIISESKDGRLRRFRRNISGYKEMDRLGLGTWDNKQWKPSDSKAYTIFNRFQKNVNGFQGDFTKCKRKI